MPHLRPVQLKRHQILFEVSDKVTDVYFPTDAVISLVVSLSTGEMIETAMVGRDGIIGAGAALNGSVSLNRAIVQIGGHALRCPVDRAVTRDYSTVEFDRTASRRIQPDDEARDRRFAAARFTHQAKRFAGGDRETDAVDGF